MPEILTESFCERCGTRYTFESVAPRKTRRLGKVKTLSKGVRNWVMSDDSSFDEAMATARSDEDREVTAQQLDAFHSTFNFCMNCRQYTCSNCWNPVEGRCLTCAPHLGHDILQAPFPEVAAFEPAGIEAGAWPEVDLSRLAGATNGTPVAGLPEANGFDHDPGDGTLEAEPAAEVETFDAAARPAFLSGEVAPEAAVADAAGETAGGEAAPALEEEPAAAPGVAAIAADAWPEDAVDVFAEPAIEADETVDAGAGAFEAGPAIAPVEAEAAEATVDEAPAQEDVPSRAAAAAVQTSDLLARFRPGQNIDAELEAYEAELAAQDAEAAASGPALEPEPEPEPVAAEPEPEPIAAAPEPEPVVAAPEPEPEPIAAAPEPEPVAAEPAPPAAPRSDVVEQPTWRIYAPEPAAPTPGQPELPGPSLPASPLQAQASGEPQWPARPDLADSPSMALLANRDRVSSDAMWAASAREVLGAPVGEPTAPTGVQPCSNCGLSLSANARFCRRCGTRQA